MSTHTHEHLLIGRAAEQVQLQIQAAAEQFNTPAGEWTVEATDYCVMVTTDDSRLLRPLEYRPGGPLRDVYGVRVCHQPMDFEAAVARDLYGPATLAGWSAGRFMHGD